MRLVAISDLHLAHEANRRALDALRPRPQDWLVLAGDVGEGVDHLVFALRLLGSRFARILWVPGNHDLWTVPGRDGQSRGEERYRELVAVCRDHGVTTPEDPYPVWPGDGPPRVIVPLFLLYDYSFRPAELPVGEALAWAAESGILCADEHYLDPAPWPSRAAWCEARCRATEQRLAALPQDHSTILVNHYPLLSELAVLPRVPRFKIWCGTRRTQAWPKRYRAETVVYGHLHIRTSRRIDGVLHEEVSLGYPRQWDSGRPIEHYLRQILPPPPGASEPERSRPGRRRSAYS